MMDPVSDVLENLRAMIEKRIRERAQLGLWAARKWQIPKITIAPERRGTFESCHLCLFQSWGDEAEHARYHFARSGTSTPRKFDEQSFPKVATYPRMSGVYAYADRL